MTERNMTFGGRAAEDQFEDFLVITDDQVDGLINHAKGLGVVLMGRTPIDPLKFAPLAVMRAYALRRKPGTTRRAVDADIDPKPLDLSRMVER